MSKTENTSENATQVAPVVDPIQEAIVRAMDAIRMAKHQVATKQVALFSKPRHQFDVTCAGKLGEELSRLTTVWIQLSRIQSRTARIIKDLR